MPPFACSAHRLSSEIANTATHTVMTQTCTTGRTGPSAISRTVYKSAVRVSESAVRVSRSSRPSSESAVRVSRPSQPSESAVRVSRPSRPSESAVRVSRPGRPSGCRQGKPVQLGSQRIRRTGPGRARPGRTGPGWAGLGRAPQQAGSTVGKQDRPSTFPRLGR